MNYGNPQLLDELAAQYALGTLRGAARSRFEKICRQRPEAMRARYRWEDRLIGLLGEVEPVAPPAHIWEKVQQRLGQSRSQNSNLFDKLFSWLNGPRLVMAAGIAAIAFSIVVITYIVIPEQQQQMASFTNDQKTEQWRVDAPKDHAKLSITRSASVSLDPNRDYELWALPDSGAAPVSLGLMPKSGKRDLPLSAAQRLALAGASKIAISLEPIGGSPTGAPTGPVLFVANVTRAA
ncbi:MAG TPA: anti-sigma factor [Steroidobacteraceae bacterium]|nr:anti-sigma factor [Steroidobacteraceae bacterium]